MPCPWSLVKRKRLAVHLHELAIEAQVILAEEQVAAEIAVVPVPLPVTGVPKARPWIVPSDVTVRRMPKRRSSLPCTATRTNPATRRR
jgi:hypothetical protein